jgi:hypothetical protein
MEVAVPSAGFAKELKLRTERVRSSMVAMRPATTAPKTANLVAQFAHARVVPRAAHHAHERAR